MKKHSWLLVIVAGLLLNFNGCKEQDVAPNLNPLTFSDDLLQIINIEEVELRSASDYLILNGKVTFASENIVEIFPMFGGNVMEVRFELGDYVKKGEILAVIKSSEVADFQQQEEEANSNLKVTQRNYDMVKDMSESGLASGRDLVEAEAELANAKAQLNRIKEVIAIYNIRNNSEYVIKAPISGFIVEKNISREMQLRSDNDKEIFTISKLDDVWILADVYENDIGKIKSGHNVEVTVPAYPNLKFNTKVDRVYNVLSPESNTLTIRVKVRNDNYLLKPGMFTKVVVQCGDGKEQLPTITSTSLIFDRNKYWVVAVNGDAFVIREVVPRNVNNSFIHIHSGLESGERVVSQNALLIYNELKQ